MSKQGFSVLAIATIFFASFFNVYPSHATTWNAAHPLEVDATQLGDSSVPGEVIEYVLEVPSAGILALEVLTSSFDAEPDLNVLAEEGSEWVLLDRASNRWTLAVLSAGPIRLEVSNQDTRLALGSYRVVSRFASTAVSSRVVELTGGPSHRWSLHGLRVERSVLSLSRISTKTRLEEADPNPGGLTSGPVGPWVEVLRLSSLAEVAADTGSGELNFSPGVQLHAAWLHDGFSSRQASRSEHLAQVTIYAENSLIHSPSHTRLEEADPNPGGLTVGNPLINLALNTRLEEADPNPGGLTVVPRITGSSMVTMKLDLAPVELQAEGRDQALQRFLSAVQSRLGGSGEPFGDLPGLCGKGDDDHEGSFACASTLPLGNWTAGSLQAERVGNDIDVFTFTLNDYSAMDIAASGLSGVASLYDDQGRRLASSSWAEAARWQKTLAPGRYFVVLEGGSGVDGDYRVRANFR